MSCGGHMETSVAPVAATLSGDRLNEAATQLRAAVDARKCWSCGCFRHALEAFDRRIPEPQGPAILAEAMASATDRLLPKQYECLGCDVCYPAVALNALGAASGCADDVCATEAVEARAGWLPLPGASPGSRHTAPARASQ